MSGNRISEVFQELLGIFRVRGGGSRDDRQLLERFIDQKDEAAFEALVQRHGPMVLGLCRRILANCQDADDAFQATFLILVRKAASIIPREVVGNWLYGVAYNVARKARALRMKRQAKEKQLETMPEIGAPLEDGLRDLRNQLDWELSRLPQKYRVPMILCGLEGMTNKEAAQELGWPEGTVSGRLTRARKILAKRLARRGLSIAVATAFVADQASFASVPVALISATIKLAALLAAQTGMAGTAIPSGVDALAKSILRSFSAKKVWAMAAIVMLGCLVGGGGLFAYHWLSNNPAPLGEKSILSSMTWQPPPLPEEMDPPQPLPEEIAKAWEQAGAKVGWLGLRKEHWNLEPEFLEGKVGKPGYWPAFWMDFAAVGQGDLSRLPVPESGFAVVTRSVEVIKKLAGLKNLRAVEFYFPSPETLKELAGLNDLQALYLYFQWSDTDLKILAKMQNLQTLYLRQVTLRPRGWDAAQFVSNAGMKDLAAMKGLKALYLGGMDQITDVGLKELARLTNLRTLDLWGTSLTDEGLKELAGLRNLEHLNLMNTGVTDAGMKFVGGFRRLRTLDLPHVTDAGLKELAELKWLRTLTLGQNQLTDKSLRVLRQIGLLHALDKAQAAGGKRPKNLSDIRSLDLSSTYVSDVGLKELAGMEGLEELNLLNRMEVPTGGWKMKQQPGAPVLKELNHNQTNVTATGFKDLTSLKNLKTLKGVSISTIEALAGLEGLQELTISSNNPIDLRKVGSLRGLRVLELRYGGTTENGRSILQDLSNLNELQTLKLTGGGGVIGLNELSRFKRLQSLDLTEFGVTSNADLKLLPSQEGPPTLKICVRWNTKADAAATINVLASLKGLRVLELRNVFPFERIDLKALRQALPECKIKYDPGFPSTDPEN